MLSRRSDLSPRLILPLVLLHLAYGFLYLWFGESIGLFSCLAALVLINLPAMTFGRLAGLLSGLSLSFILALGVIRDQFSVSAASSQRLTMLVQALLPHWPLLIGLPLAGLLLGLYAEWFGNRRPEGARRLRLLKEKNSRLEAVLKSLASEPVYYTGWSKLKAQNPLNERLVSLIAAIQTRGDARGDVFWTSDSTSQLFREYTRMRPEVLAVLELDGTILQANKDLFAIYGYTDIADRKSVSISSFLQPADKKTVAGFLDNILTLGRGTSELFDMAPPSEAVTLPEQTAAAETAEAAAISSQPATTATLIQTGPAEQTETLAQLLISPSIYLECAGSPLTLVAAVAHNVDFSFNESRQSPLSELANQAFCCLTLANCISYANIKACELLESSASELIGQSLERHLSLKYSAVAAEIERECRAGRSPVREIELSRRTGGRRILKISAHPALTSTGRYLGCTLIFEDVTSLRLISQAAAPSGPGTNDFQNLSLVYCRSARKT